MRSVLACPIHHVYHFVTEFIGNIKHPLGGFMTWVTPKIRCGIKSLSFSACLLLAASSMILASAPAELSFESENCPEQTEIPAPELEDGENAITCDLVGRVVVLDDVAVYVPSP